MPQAHRNQTATADAKRTWGTRGPQGERGAIGPRGSTGARGERGPAGPAATRSQILEAVQSEFDGIRKELRTQLERMAQIQRQLDSIESTLRQLISKAPDA